VILTWQALLLSTGLGLILWAMLIEAGWWLL